MVTGQVGPSGSGAVEVVILAQSVTLTDAQIRALPSTPFQILDAPDEDQYIQVQEIILSLDNQAGAYEGTTGLELYGLIGSSGATNHYVEDDQLAFEDDSGSAHQIRIPPITATNGTASWFGDANAIAGRPLMLFSTGTGGIDLTGGNIANSMKVTVLYTIIVP